MASRFKAECLAILDQVEQMRIRRPVPDALLRRAVMGTAAPVECAICLGERYASIYI
jgi:hypothetical protein